MFLTASNLVYYLVHRGLITPESVVEGDFAVVEAGRRNRNFKIERRRNPGLFVKQVTTVRPDATVTVWREAAFYDMVHRRPKLAALARLVPRFVDYDSTTHTLVVELVSGYEPLADYHLRVGRFPEAVGRAIGRHLAETHLQIAATAGDPATPHVFPCHPPWILTLGPAGILQAVGQLGTAGPQLAAYLSACPGFLEEVSALIRYWQFDSMIHGDFKWDNCLVSVGADGQPALRIVDWELVDLGDASWDLAAVIAAYLVFAVMTTTLPAEQAPAGLNVQARDKLKEMAPQFRAVWQTYAAARQFAHGAGRGYLLRCLKFCAARMLLSVFELLAGAPQMVAPALAMIQIGYGILTDPDRAVAELAGADAL